MKKFDGVEFFIIDNQVYRCIWILELQQGQSKSLTAGYGSFL